MDSEITKAITSLGNRMSSQEQLHKNIDINSHGVVSNLPALILAIVLSALITVAIVRNSNKNT